MVVVIVGGINMVSEPPPNPSEDSTELYREGWTGSAGGRGVKVGVHLQETGHQPGGLTRLGGTLTSTSSQ